MIGWVPRGFILGGGLALVYAVAPVTFGPAAFLGVGHSAGPAVFVLILAGLAQVALWLVFLLRHLSRRLPAYFTVTWGLSVLTAIASFYVLVGVGAAIVATIAATQTTLGQDAPRALYIALGVAAVLHSCTLYSHIETVFQSFQEPSQADRSLAILSLIVGGLVSMATTRGAGQMAIFVVGCLWGLQLLKALLLDAYYGPPMAASLLPITPLEKVRLMRRFGRGILRRIPPVQELEAVPRPPGLELALWLQFVLGDRMVLLTVPEKNRGLRASP